MGVRFPRGVPHGDVGVAALHGTWYVSWMAYDRNQNTSDRRAYRHRAAAALIAAMSGKCRGCGYDHCATAFDFHHVDPSAKAFTIHNAIGTKAWASVTTEATKCVLVCCRCHREIHAGVRQCPVLIKYAFPSRLISKRGPNKRSFQRKPCPVDAGELEHIRSTSSLSAMARHFGVNRRTIARWCRMVSVV